MSVLRFEDLDIRVLSPTWATVFGRFVLQREEPLPDLTGLFTLLVQNTRVAGLLCTIIHHPSNPPGFSRARSFQDAAMQLDLQGKVLAVTGAGGRLARSIMRAFAPYHATIA